MIDGRRFADAREHGGDLVRGARIDQNSAPLRIGMELRILQHRAEGRSVPNPPSPCASAVISGRQAAATSASVSF